MNLFNITNRVNLKVLNIILGLILFGSQIMLAQTGSNPSPVNYNIDVYPKTPEAAALSKFVDIPAGSYTGVADFSIPLYTIEFDGGSIPIELRYTTTGIKVGEIASRVGLGWVLNAGPSLSQQVIGVHDKTFPRPVVETNYNATNNTESYNIALKTAGINNGGLSPVDIKPDIFSYSLLSASGKYIIDAGGTYGIPMPYNQIKITPSSYYNLMDLVDEQGIQYKFENYPGSASKNTCADENLNGLTYADPNFKITKIKSPKGQEVTYLYGRNINQAKYINSITTQQRIKIEGIFPMTGTPHPPAPQCINYTSLVDQALTEIQFKGGKVLLSYSDNGVRSDVNGEVYLTGVVVVNDKNQTIKNFSFTYDYFDSPESVPTYGPGFSFLNPYTQGMDMRLKLFSIKDNLTGGAYYLEYYESHENKVLPIRTSNDQDYWGVFNGADNGNKSTAYTKYNSDGIIILKGDGANKEPDIDYGKLGNLYKITYPTGGYTQIEYEADDYIKANHVPPVYEYQYNEEDLFADEYTPSVFTIPENAYRKRLSFFGDNTGTTPSELYCTWKLRNNQNVVVGSGQGTGNFDRADPAGTYTLEIIPGENSYGACYADYDWINEIVINNSDTRNAGTIRVQKIESFDNNDGKIIREYTYKEPTINHVLPYTKSSGKNLGNEIFSAVSTQWYPLDHQGKYAHETLLSNNPGWQTATVRGKPIGYDYVQEKYVSESNPSKSHRKEYTFKNDIDDVWAQYNPYDPINYTWPIEGLDRGLLLEEKLFDSSNKHVQTTIKKYELNTHFNTTATSYIGGQFLGEGLEIIPIKHLGSGTSGYEFKSSTFPIKNYWITDTITTTREYITPTYFLETVKSTKYSTLNYKHTYPVETKITGSLGETMRTEYYYPQDLDEYYEQSSMMAELVQRNQIGSPVITKSFENGKPISEQRTHYAHFYPNDPSTGFILPQFIYFKKGEIGATSSVEDRKITYDRYDIFGNLEQYTMENGTVVSIIWGYDKKYPIAKIEGLAHNSFSNSLNSLIAIVVNKSNADTNASTETELITELENLRKHADLENAVVTTYTYDPLKGVTTVIAPNGQESFYLYDDAGRLDKILDKNKKVLKKMEYNYQH